MFVASLFPLLASCGGGGDPGVSAPAAAPPPPPGPSSTQAQFKGTLVTSAGPLAGAEVYLPVNGGQYSTTTDAAGNYSLIVPIADFANLGLIALRAYKDGYEPFFVTYAGPLTGGGTYTLAPGGNVMTQLAPNEFSSRNFAGLYHLGDNNFSGAANSQLQTSATGVSAGIVVFNWNPADNGKFHTARVSFLVRGLEGSILQTKGLVGLTDATGTQLGSSAVLDMDSDPNGGYSRLSFDFALPPNIAAGGIKFDIQTGAKPGDYDDIEFTGISIQLI
jgi:hypothetical protein